MGKTTTAVNLGIGLTRKGKKVLLIDADPQGSMTASLGYIQPDDIKVTLARVIVRRAAVWSPKKIFKKVLTPT